MILSYLKPSVYHDFSIETQIIVFRNITVTSKRNFVTFFRNFTETKLCSTWNSYCHVLKMKCLQKLEMDS